MRIGADPDTRMRRKRGEARREGMGEGDRGEREIERSGVRGQGGRMT